MLDENKARDELEKILSQQEYTVYGQKGIFQVIWEKAKEWIIELLAKLIPSYQPTNAFASTILIVMIIIALVLLLVAIFFLIRYVKRKRMYQEKTPLQSMAEMQWSFQMHLKEAEKQEALAQYSPATRHLFLALLLYFHEQEWLEARIWKTNWEYYEELKKVNPHYAKQFYDVALLFDEVTYGERSVQKEEFEQFRETVMNWFNQLDKQELG